jgi:hypothetical protein
VQKVHKTPLNRKKLDMVMNACHPSNRGKLKIVGLQSRLAWAKSKTYLQKTRAKLAQAVVCLPSKCKALRSNPSTTKKKKIKKKVPEPFKRSSAKHHHVPSLLQTPGLFPLVRVNFKAERMLMGENFQALSSSSLIEVLK